MYSSMCLSTYGCPGMDVSMYQSMYKSMGKSMGISMDISMYLTWCRPIPAYKISGHADVISIGHFLSDLHPRIFPLQQHRVYPRFYFAFCQRPSCTVRKTAI